jgi:hypothetical protein
VTSTTALPSVLAGRLWCFFCWREVTEQHNEWFAATHPSPNSSDHAIENYANLLIAKTKIRAADLNALRRVP